MALTDEAAPIREHSDPYAGEPGEEGLNQDDDRGVEMLEEQAAGVSFWQRLLTFLAPTRAERTEQAQARVRDIDEALEQHPDSAANYVLRGEVYLELADYEQAAADFRRALELAAAQVERDDWGLVAQAVQDRALARLVTARRALGKH